MGDPAQLARSRWTSVFHARGGFEGGVGSFYNEIPQPEGPPARVRFRFLDITDESLRWDGYRSTDGGESWNGFWIMRFDRRDPKTDRGLLLGPTQRIADRCDRDRARAFDFLVGDWRGEETLADPGGGSMTRTIDVSAWSILEGCAVMDLEESVDREDDRGRFRVRSFVPVEGVGA